MDHRPVYKVHTFDDIDAVAPLLQALADRKSPGLLFQELRWIRPWYESFRLAGARPLIVVVTEGGEAADVERVALVLPLIRRRKRLLPLVEFADRGVTDYNLPIEGPRAPQTAADAELLMAAVEKAVRPFFRLRLSKMPRQLNGRLNSLARLTGAGVTPLTAHNLKLPADSSGFLRSFGKKKRVEIERVGRGLNALGDNHFAIATSQRERGQVFALIQQSQRVRIPDKGERYFLEEPGYRQFYETLVFDPADTSATVLSAIWLEGRPVAGLLGVRHDQRYIALRMGISGEPEIKRLGLGKVILLRTAEWAIDQKLGVFDFSLGGTTLKAWFHPEPFELIEYKSWVNGLLPRWAPSPTAPSARTKPAVRSSL